LAAVQSGMVAAWLFLWLLIFQSLIV